MPVMNVNLLLDERTYAGVKSGTVPTFEPSDFEENAFIMINRQY